MKFQPKQDSKRIAFLPVLGTITLQRHFTLPAECFLFWLLRNQVPFLFFLSTDSKRQSPYSGFVYKSVEETAGTVVDS